MVRGAVKRWSFYLLSFKMLMVFSNMVVSAQSMEVFEDVINPSFEAELVDGVIPGWEVDEATADYGSISISTDYARTGSNSLLFEDQVSGTNPEGHFRVLSNAIAVKPGDVVTYEVYVYREATSDQTHGIQPVIHYFDSNGNEVKINDFLHYGQGRIHNGQWNQLMLTAEVPENTEFIKVGLYSGFPSLTKVYLDDVTVSIERTDEPDEKPKSNLSNPSFEMQLVDGRIPGWEVDLSTIDNGSISLSTKFAREGSHSLLFEDTSSTSGKGHFRLLSEGIAVMPGDQVTFDLYVYREVKADQTHGIQPVIHYYDEEGSEVKINDFVHYGQASLQDQTWNKLTISKTVPENTSYIKVGLYSGHPSLTKVYLDDAKVTIESKDDTDEIFEGLINGQFEEPAIGGKIPGWSIDPGSDGKISLSTEVVHSGSNSLYFEDSSETQGLRVVSNKFNITPGVSFILKASINVISQSHNIVPEVQFFNEQGELLKHAQDLYGSDLLGTNTWKDMYLFTEVPEDAAYGQVSFYSGGISLTKAYIDNVSFTTEVTGTNIPHKYGEPESLGTMVHIGLGQSGAIQTTKDGRNEVYFFANGTPATFYALDGETGERIFAEQVPNTEAQWAMTIADDQNVYFASTLDGILYRYIPDEKRIEVLGENPSGNFVWDLEVIGDKIYGSTFHSTEYGKVFEYDITTGKFRDYGVVSPGQAYVRGIAVDDQYIYAAVGTTKGLFKINRITGEKTEIEVPGHSGETGIMADAFRIGQKLFVSASSQTMVVLDLETETVDATFQYSSMISAPHPENGDLIYFAYQGKLFTYDISTKETTELPINVPDVPRYKDLTWITMNSGEKAGETVLAMITQYGDYILYDPSDNWITQIPLDMDLGAVTMLSIEVGEDGRLYFGGYQRGASVYNPFEDTLDVSIPSIPQVSKVGFLNGLVFYGTYPSANMYVYDPAKPLKLNENPGLVFTISDQDRPNNMVAGENKLFIGSVPDYGKLGGSLTIYDMETDTWTQYDHHEIIPNQAITSMVYKDGLLYGGTSIWGGLGIEPSEPEAKMFIWDVAQGKKIDEFTLDIPNIDEAPKIIGELTFGPDGLLWGAVNGTIFAMDVETKEIVKSRMIRPSKYNTNKHESYKLKWSPDGLLYTTLARQLIVVDPETLDYKVISDQFMNEMNIGIDGSIYFSLDGATLHVIHMPETDATLASVKLNGVLLDGFSPGIREYSVSIDKKGELEVTPRQDGAKVVILDDRDQTKIQVTAPDGVSKLEYVIHWVEDSAEGLLDALSDQLEAYIRSGDVKGPLVNQLRNSLKQAEHHLAKGSDRKAADFVEKFLKHINNGPMQKHMSDEAKADLTERAELLLEKLN